jgi:hypothetical protein
LILMLQLSKINYNIWKWKIKLNYSVRNDYIGILNVYCYLINVPWPLFTKLDFPYWPIENKINKKLQWSSKYMWKFYYLEILCTVCKAFLLNSHTITCYNCLDLLDELEGLIGPHIGGPYTTKYELSGTIWSAPIYHFYHSVLHFQVSCRSCGQMICPLKGSEQFPMVFYLQLNSALVYSVCDMFYSRLFFI